MKFSPKDLNGYASGLMDHDFTARQIMFSDRLKPHEKCQVLAHLLDQFSPSRARLFAVEVVEKMTEDEKAKELLAVARKWATEGALEDEVVPAYQMALRQMKDLKSDWEMWLAVCEAFSTNRVATRILEHADEHSAEACIKRLVGLLEELG